MGRPYLVDPDVLRVYVELLYQQLDPGGRP